jgi:hypothetical protein
MAGSLHFPDCVRAAAVLALCLSLTGPRARAEQLEQTEEEGDRGASVHVGGLLQVDSVVIDRSSVDELDPATREPLNQQRFVLQRAWLRADADYQYVRGLIVAEGSTARGPALRLLTAELSVFYPDLVAARGSPASERSEARPLVELTLGLMLIPFGIETRELVPDRMFLEASSWVNALFPGRRDLGARVRGEWSFVRYALAVMNGNPIASSSLPLRDPNRAKDLLGRVGVEDDLWSWLRVAAGVSALLGRGFHPGVAPTKDTFTLRDVNEDGIAQPSEIQFVAGEPGEPSKNFDHRALAGDLTFAYQLPALGPGRLYGEVAWAQNLDRNLFVSDPVSSGRELRQLGVMLALRQSLTRHAELGVRFDRYDPDRDSSGRRGAIVVPYDARFDTLGVAAAWCTLPHLRFTLQYDHRTNPLGRDARGANTTLAADSLILRAQLEL